MKRTVLVLTLWVLTGAAAGVVHDWLGYSLKNLATARNDSLQQYRGTPVLMSFFEPECPWCFRQLQDLERMQGQCRGSFQPIALGVNGGRRELRHIFARTQATFPAFIASPRMLADIGGVPATPITVLIDAAGEAVGAVRGYRSPTELRALLVAIEPETLRHCQWGGTVELGPR